MNKEFRIARTVTLPAPADTVFDAVSVRTAGWMFPKENVEEVGGNGADDPTVKVWEPAQRLSVGVEGEDGYFNALDYQLEKSDGGTTLSYEHRGVFEEDIWDTQYAACDSHTDFYLHTLGEYVSHFAGQDATFIDVHGPEASMTPDALDKFRTEVGIGEVGSTVTFEVPGYGTADAIVDYNAGSFIGLRSDRAMYRIFGRNTWGGPVGVAGHLFDGSDQDSAQAAWQKWLDGVFA